MKRTKAVVEKITMDFITLLAGDEEKELIVPAEDLTLPDGLKEGDWLEIEITGDNVHIIGINEEETLHVKKRIQEKMDLLRKRSADIKKDRGEENGSPDDPNEEPENP